MIMPIGIIEQSTEDGATFILTRPGDHNILKVNSPVMVRNTHRGRRGHPQRGHGPKPGHGNRTHHRDVQSSGIQNRPLLAKRRGYPGPRLRRSLDSSVSDNTRAVYNSA